MKSLTLCNKTVCVNDEGMVSLTDMWKASGGKQSKEPRKFLIINSTKLLIENLENRLGTDPVVVAQGRYGGTWCHKKLASKYSTWCQKRYLMPRVTKLHEEGALKAIEQVLGLSLIKQYQVGKYYLDGYCKETNTAYEIDEPQHFINGKLKASCIARQKFIERSIGCRFVRIKI